MESTEGNAIRKDEIAKLLRYESTDFGAGELTSLEEYIGRMKEDQRYIFYLPVKNRQQALSRYFLGFQHSFNPFEKIKVFVNNWILLMDFG